MSRFKHIIDQEPSQQSQQDLPPDWPKVFPKPIVGLDRDGVINVNRDHYITDPVTLRCILSPYQLFLSYVLKGTK